MKKQLLLVLLASLLLALPSAAFAQGEGGDKFVVGGQYQLGPGERLDGNLTVLGGQATLAEDSVVSGDLALVGGKALVSGDVLGDIIALGGLVELRDSAVVSGDLALLGGSVRRAPGAVVKGEMLDRPRIPFAPDLELPSVELPEPPLIPAAPPIRGPFDWLGRAFAWQLSTIGQAILAVLLALVLLAIAPRNVRRIAATARLQPAVCFGAGLATLAVGFLAGALLLLACGLGLLVWLALICAWLVGWVAMGLLFGRWLLGALGYDDPNILWAGGLGIFLITIASRLPWCIGFLFSLAVGCIGLGAVVLTRLGTQAPGGGQDLSAWTAESDPYAPALPPPAEEASDGDSVHSAMGDSSGSDSESGGSDVVAVAAAMPTAPAKTGAGQGATIRDIKGIGEVTAQRLAAAGVVTLDDVVRATPTELAAATGRTEQRVVTEDWQGQARRLLA